MARMRTTITLDDDVAIALKRLRKTSDASFKDVVNDTLRCGLRAKAAPPASRRPFRTPVLDGGAFLIDIDNVAEAIAQAEGEDFK